MMLRREGLLTSVNILRLNLPNYCHLYFVNLPQNKQLSLK